MTGPRCMSFRDWKELRTVDLSMFNTSQVTTFQMMFAGCINLERICIPENVKFISRGAFSECINLKEIEIPESVEDLGDWCFNKCRSLERVIIPRNLSIKPNTFNSCNAEVIGR